MIGTLLTLLPICFLYLKEIEICLSYSDIIEQVTEPHNLINVLINVFIHYKLQHFHFYRVFPTHEST